MRLRKIVRRFWDWKFCWDFLMRHLTRILFLAFTKKIHRALKSLNLLKAKASDYKRLLNCYIMFVVLSRSPLTQKALFMIYSGNVPVQHSIYRIWMLLWSPRFKSRSNPNVIFSSQRPSLWFHSCCVWQQRSLFVSNETSKAWALINTLWKESPAVMKQTKVFDPNHHGISFPTSIWVSHSLQWSFFTRAIGQLPPQGDGLIASFFSFSCFCSTPRSFEKSS